MDTRFLSVLTGNPRGDTPFYWTHQDQLETRTAGYQIPTISSGCLLIKYSPFSCSFLTRSVIALEDEEQPTLPGHDESYGSVHQSGSRALGTS